MGGDVPPRHVAAPHAIDASRMNMLTVEETRGGNSHVGPHRDRIQMSVDRKSKKQMLCRRQEANRRSAPTECNGESGRRQLFECPRGRPTDSAIKACKPRSVPQNERMAPERAPPIARIHQTELSHTARPMIAALGPGSGRSNAHAERQRDKSCSRAKGQKRCPSIVERPVFVVRIVRKQRTAAAAPQRCGDTLTPC